MKIIGIIPARFASTRFPGKPLALIGNKTMIQRVIEQAEKATTLADVLVATDDERIFSLVDRLGKKAILTSPEHPSGTDRCLEAWLKTDQSADAIVNIQGDEPFVLPEQIDTLAQRIRQPEVDIATLALPITDQETLFNPNKVKVIFDKNRRAIYFSRQAIPYQKSTDAQIWVQHYPYYKHMGLYAYKSQILKSLCTLPPSPLEMAESLEQLRWLENGYSIHIDTTNKETPAIDTPEDLEKVLAEYPLN